MKLKHFSKLAISAAALALLAACGGGGGSDGSGGTIGDGGSGGGNPDPNNQQDNGNQQDAVAGLAACFTVTPPVNYKLDMQPLPPPLPTFDQMKITQETINGKVVMLPMYYAAGVAIDGQPWSVSGSDVTIYPVVGPDLKNMNPDDVPLTFSNMLNMKAGGSVEGTKSSGGVSVTQRITFIEYVDLPLPGKTFKNTCHLHADLVNSDKSLSSVGDVWYAPGYYIVKSTDDLLKMTNYTYAGDLP